MLASGRQEQGAWLGLGPDVAAADIQGVGHRLLQGQALGPLLQFFRQPPEKHPPGTERVFISFLRQGDSMLEFVDEVCLIDQKASRS